MPSAVELTGAWSGDDGAIYYIRGNSDGTVAWAGLHDSGFHKGMEFTNVFMGSVSSDGGTIDGSWADVPRGETLNSGHLSFAIVNVQPVIELRRVDGETTGGFGAKVLTSGASPLGRQDIDNLTGRVQRFDRPLGENNPPCRDFSVMWGAITEVDWPSRPPNTDYCTFVSHGPWNGDGDFDFHLVPDWSMAESTFWTAGWLDKVFYDPIASDSGDLPVFAPANEYIAQLFGRFNLFNCEAAMFARENDHDHCKDPPVNLLPGWFEQRGNSVLVNGRPINGYVAEVGSPQVKALQFNVGRLGKQVITLQQGAVARITGVVADDAGHEDTVPPEIHPVYAIDVVPDFIVRPPGVNMTGAWHADDVGTYYLRQIGNTLWWLGLSRDQGRSFANVFCGTIDGIFIRGNWIDVPMGVDGILSGGSLTLVGTDLSTEMVKISQVNSFGASHWTKLYDTEWKRTNTTLNLNGNWTDGSSRSAVIFVEFTSLTVDMSDFIRPTAHGVIVDASTITVTFPDDATYTGQLQPPDTITWSNGSVWTKIISTVMDLNGNWTDGSFRSAFIYEGPEFITIDMSYFDRPNANGPIVDASNITVTFPDDATYTGQLQPPDTIIWSNGSNWIRKP